ncbi:hypothetical protein UNSWCD_499 [Campylobacter concisus UNSWCD]|nr:hypothetical protein UNSWCD_499 [Campylobacter concisus UNSWCD]
MTKSRPGYFYIKMSFKMRKNTANIKAKTPSFTSSLILPLNSAIITLFMIYAFKLYPTSMRIFFIWNDH